MNTASRIVLLRGRLGLSQKTFAELIGKSSGFVNKVENGRTLPSPELINSISSTFGVPTVWLEKGEGVLIIDSVGDRIRQARRSGDYTQEELAEMLHISRNSVGMIERGEMRASDEILTTFCERLWINKRWLLTGVGSMERTELTSIYELLKKDPELRDHIQSFIEHLNKKRYRHRSTADDEESEDPVEMVPARGINDVDQAKLFFEHYNIRYELDQDGQLLVLKPRMIDHERQREAEERCRKAKLSSITDHPSCFRSVDGGTVICFAPYDVENTPSLPWIEESEYNFYGFGTTMYVVKA